MPLEKHPFIALSQEEIEDPALVFDRLFEYARFPDLRKSLEDIKRWLINRNYPYTEDERELENTVYFFEKLQSLLEAAYIMRHGR
jgi:hypothetical protein